MGLDIDTLLRWLALAVGAKPGMVYDACASCGKRLTGPKSRLIGFGRCCARKHEAFDIRTLDLFQDELGEQDVVEGKGAL